jgi:hypothetical protein
MTLLLALLGPASATEVGAILRPEVTVDIAADRDGEDAADAITRVRAFASDNLDNGSRWFLEVQGQQATLIGEDVEGSWEATVGESGWAGSKGAIDLRVGNLIERWGKLDFLSQLDVINPRDLRQGPLVPTEFRRIAMPMATVGVGSAPIRGELTLVPFAAAHRVSVNGTDWSFVRQGDLEETLDEISNWSGTQFSEAQFGSLFGALSDSVASMDPSFRRGLDAATNQQELPQSLVYNGEAFGRIELEIVGLDAALMGGNMRSRQRAAQLHPRMTQMLQEGILPESEELETLTGGQFIDASWPRTWVAGAEGSTLVGPFGLRFESLFRDNEAVALRWMQTDTAPSVSSGLGIDYANSSVFYAVFEMSHKHLFNAPTDLILQTNDAFQLAGGIRVNALAQRLEIQLGGSYHTNYREYLARPTVSYRVSDPVEIEVGALLMGGPRPSPTRLLDAIVYRGGMAGYFSPNDAVTVAVSWIL